METERGIDPVLYADAPAASPMMAFAGGAIGGAIMLGVLRGVEALLLKFGLGPGAEAEKEATEEVLAAYEARISAMERAERASEKRTSEIEKLLLTPLEEKEDELVGGLVSQFTRLEQDLATLQDWTASVDAKLKALPDATSVEALRKILVDVQAAVGPAETPKASPRGKKQRKAASQEEPTPPLEPEPASQAAEPHRRVNLTEGDLSRNEGTQWGKVDPSAGTRIRWDQVVGFAQGEVEA